MNFADCTFVTTSDVPTWCRLGESEMDPHGCPLAPKVICAEDQVSTTSGPPSFTAMLTPEYFVRNISDQNPDPAKFHSSFGPPYNSSGKFHACELHSDCFEYREPKEWCQRNSNSVWM